MNIRASGDRLKLPTLAVIADKDPSGLPPSIPLPSITGNAVNIHSHHLRQGRGSTLDIYILLHRYATDIISEFSYGPAGNTNSLVSRKYRYVAEEFSLSDRRVYQLCQIHIPLLTGIWTWIQKILSGPKEMGVVEYGWHAVKNAKAEKILDSEESLVSLMLSNEQQFSDAYIASSELFDHMVNNLSSQICRDIFE